MSVKTLKTLKKDAELYKRIFQQSKEKAWDILDEARDDFFSMKPTVTESVPRWIVEWFVKWLGSKPREKLTE